MSHHSIDSTKHLKHNMDVYEDFEEIIDVIESIDDQEANEE